MNTADPRNFRKNDPTKVNNNDKPREKVGQSSNNSVSLVFWMSRVWSHEI